MKKLWIVSAAVLLLGSLLFTGCTANLSLGDTGSAQAASETETGSPIAVSPAAGSLLDTETLFTERDLIQTANLEGAEYITLTNGQDITIGDEGVYFISGNAENATIIVDSGDKDKVQIVLDGVCIENESAPAIYVKSAKKVFITTTENTSRIEVSGEYSADGETNPDAVIFSKSDLTLNGTGTLEIISNAGNGITSKDDLKITGGIYVVNALLDGLEANDSIRIAGGDITVTADKDALHSENGDDSSLGYIYMSGGGLHLNAGDDGMHGTSIVQIDGGTIAIDMCYEGIEGTYVQINGGDITIYARDDGINAVALSGYDVCIEVNGGTITDSVGSGDTDAFDSNGSIFINGGTISVSANSAFDSDSIAQLNAGTVTVNGQIITEITQSQMRGPGGGDRPGGLMPGDTTDRRQPPTNP